jgi:drug/metabolite transporter (DMT)-like permease
MNRRKLATLMLQDQQQIGLSAQLAERASPALPFGDCHDARAMRVAVSVRSQKARVAWLALWMAGAIASYIAAALAVRALAKSLNVFEIMSVRSAAGLAILLVLMAVRPNLGRGLASRRIGLHLARNSVHFVGQTIWALAITLLPFATVFSLEFTAPIWVALLAVMLLGERLTLPRGASIGLCLIGVLVILHPGLSNFQPVALLALGAAITRAFTDVVTKKLTQTETTFAILFWMNLMQLPMNLAGSDPLFVTRLDASTALPLIGPSLYCRSLPLRRRDGSRAARFSARSVDRLDRVVFLRRSLRCAHARRGRPYHGRCGLELADRSAYPK